MPNYWPNRASMTDIKSALEQAAKLLTPVSPTPRLDAELLLTKILTRSRTFFYTHPEDTLTSAQAEQYQQVLRERLNGVPVAYLTGIREFWSLSLQVSRDTLIPRPETELLVELALKLTGEASNVKILDLGTGSGAIALALASERPDWTLLACDKSQAAVDVARANATRLGMHNVNVLCSNWFESIPAQQFNAIAEQDPHLDQGDVGFEPRDALISGTEGLDALHYLIQQSKNWLLPNGLLLLEHGYQQGVAVTNMLTEYGYQDVQCWQDWQGLDRVSGGRANSE
jgi:release factor glutamine methyltransferase